MTTVLTERDIEDAIDKLLHSAHDKEREDFQKLSWVGSVA